MPGCGIVDAFIQVDVRCIRTIEPANGRDQLRGRDSHGRWHDGESIRLIADVRYEVPGHAAVAGSRAHWPALFSVSLRCRKERERVALAVYNIIRPGRYSGLAKLRKAVRSAP